MTFAQEKDKRELVFQLRLNGMLEMQVAVLKWVRRNVERMEPEQVASLVDAMVGRIKEHEAELRTQEVIEKAGQS